MAKSGDVFGSGFDGVGLGKTVALAVVAQINDERLQVRRGVDEAAGKATPVAARAEDAVGENDNVAAGTCGSGNDVMGEQR